MIATSVPGTYQSGADVVGILFPCCAISHVFVSTFVCSFLVSFLILFQISSKCFILNLFTHFLFALVFCIDTRRVSVNLCSTPQMFPTGSGEAQFPHSEQWAEILSSAVPRPASVALLLTRVHQRNLHLYAAKHSFSLCNFSDLLLSSITRYRCKPISLLSLLSKRCFVQNKRQCFVCVKGSKGEGFLQGKCHPFSHRVLNFIDIGGYN